MSCSTSVRLRRSPHSRIPTSACRSTTTARRTLLTDPSGCSADEQQVLTNALRRSAVAGNALMLTEFGATDDLSDLGRIVADADSDQISWIEWAYCGCGDPTGTIPPSIEGLVSNPRLAGTGSNVDAAKFGGSCRALPAGHLWHTELVLVRPEDAHIRLPVQHPVSEREAVRRGFLQPRSWYRRSSSPTGTSPR